MNSYKVQGTNNDRVALDRMRHAFKRLVFDFRSTTSRYPLFASSDHLDSSQRATELSFGYSKKAIRGMASIFFFVLFFAVSWQLLIAFIGNRSWSSYALTNSQSYREITLDHNPLVMAASAISSPLATETVTTTNVSASAPPVTSANFTMTSPRSDISEEIKFHITKAATYHEVFNKIYVLSLPACDNRWLLMKKWGDSVGLNLTLWLGSSYDDINLENPPIPILNLPARDTVTAGQVGCTLSHVKIWRDIFKNKHKRVLVLEDDVTMTQETLNNLPLIIGNADVAAKERNQPWHYMYFRRAPFGSPRREKIWAEGPRRQPITIASPSWGTAAYAITLEGAEWLLSHMTYYQFPLDVQIENIQRKYAKEFIALSACNNRNFQYLCPENIIEFTRQQKGKCAYSASQSGSRKIAKELPTDPLGVPK